MKAIRLKVSTFLLTLGAMLCALVGFVTPINVSASASTDVKESYWMQTGVDATGNGVYQKTSNLAGETSGYDKYVLGEEVTLNATANEGYHILGWRIEYSGSSVEGLENPLIITTTADHVFTVEDEDGESSVEVTFKATNLGDENCTSSQLTLTKAFAGLTIEPLFGYTYYNLDVTDISPFVDQSEIDIKIYTQYVATAGAEEELLENCYVVTGSGTPDAKVYYFETLYQEEAGTGYYVYQNGEKVDCLKGAYKLGEEVSIQAAILETSLIQGVDATLTSDKNSSVILDSVSTESALTDNTIYYGINEKNLTNYASAKFNIIGANDLVNKLTLNYQQVYIVELKVNLDGASTDSDISNQLLSVIRVENYVYYNALTYYVKEYTDNANNKKFTISASDYYYTDSSTGKQYAYYDIEKVGSETDKASGTIKATFGFDSDKPENIVIEFASHKYEIDFKFAVRQNGKITELSGDYKVNAPIATTKGVENSLAFVAAEAKNTGYDFVGFALTKNDETLSTEVTVTINATTPENVTYLMVYEKIQYTIKIANYNQIKLNNGAVVLPNPQISLVTTNYGTESLAVATEDEFTTDEFTTKLTIGDIVTLKGTVTDGFLLEGFYKDSDLTKKLSSGILSIDAEFIENYFIENYFNENDANESSTITIYLNENYASYTLTYYIQASSTGEDDDGNIIMADIYASNPDLTNKNYITISVEDAAVIDGNGVKGTDVNDNGEIEIVISGLKKFDKIDLYAKGKNLTEGSKTEESKIYKFIMFTADGVSPLTDVDGSADPTYKYTVSVTANNMSIKAVYAMPVTSMSLNVVGYANGFVLDNLVITYDNGQKDVELEISNMVYEVTKGEHTIDLTTAIIKGCYVKSIVVKNADESLTLTQNGAQYTFTIEDVTDYELIIEIEKYDYVFNIFDSYDGTFGNSPTYTIGDVDIEKRTLTFNKTLGYYVSSVLAGADKTEYALMNETNENEAVAKYSYEFAIGELEIFGETYGELDQESFRYTINIYVTYVRHTFTIKITNPILNAKGNANDRSVAQPTFSITYKNDVGEDVKIVPTITDYNTSERSVTLRGIPYGKAFTINVNGLENLNFGVEIDGWTNHLNAALDSSIYTISGNNVNATGITQNQQLFFRIRYSEYDLNPYIEDRTQGSSRVEVGGIEKHKITLFDRMEIDALPNISGGYVFKSFEYYTVQKYVYIDDTQWQADRASLYLRENGIYVLNTESDYNQNAEYYKIVKNTITNSSVFSVSEFNPAQMFVDNNGFFVVVEFKLREVNIVNVSESSTSLTGYNALHIPTSEFASYAVTAILDGEETILNLDSKVDVRYSIKIDIQINKNAKNGSLEEYFDLTSGIYLNTYREDGYNIQDLGGGAYLLEFNMSDFMDRVLVEAGKDILKIQYNYIVEPRELTVTTNVYESSRTEDISDFINNVNMTIDFGEFGSGSTTSNNTGKVTDVNEFLSKTTVTYTLTGNYNSYIRIYSVKAYDIYTREEYTDLAEAGITVDKTDSGITSVSVRYLKNIKLVFIVTPLVELDGKVLGTEDVEKEVTFEPDENGYGKVQNFAKWISAMPAVKNAMSITYKNENGLTIEEPSNAGKYKVELTFYSSTLKWLNVINIDCNISYVIEKKDISITYDQTQVKKITKEYNPQRNISVSEFLDYLIFTDSQGFKMPYAQVKANLENGSSFVLNSINYRALVSYTDKGIQIETVNANEKVYYNITIDGLELKDNPFNNNYNLMNPQVVILECIQISRKEISVGGIIVNNKVYDGTSLATLSQDSKLQLYGVFEGDDVTINKDKVLLQFVDYRVGENKTVTIDALTALEGEQVDNYTVKTMAVTGKVVYPYELKAEVANVGEIIVRNDIGLADPTKANLIPLNSSLNIKLIEPDTADYAEIYSSISKYLSRTNVFAIGFRINFALENGKTAEISKELSFAVPSVENLTNVICLDGTMASKVDYEVKDGVVYLDLTNYEGGIRDILLTEKRALLPLWAIILIVVVGVLAIGGGVTAFVLSRKKKAKQYSINDKI